MLANRLLRERAQGKAVVLLKDRDTQIAVIKDSIGRYCVATPEHTFVMNIVEVMTFEALLEMPPLPQNVTKKFNYVRKLVSEDITRRVLLGG